MLDLYALLLLEEGARTNLTSKADREALYQKHIVTSLAILRALEDACVTLSPALDVGSGAGFPGLPIKIVRPEIEMTLLEATGKKTSFLESAVGALKLDGIRVIQARAEDLARDPEHRGAYNLVLARAVAPLPVLLELTLPFLAPNGVLAAPKGSARQREVAESASALATLGGTIEATLPLQIPGPGPQQALVLVRKTGPTPDKYPRRPGIPAKRSL
ncbi:MAG: 16S rRNA (guanine(527)-N(7))-methyltransferase RsmG [Chloroflexota bacterium]